MKADIQEIRPIILPAAGEMIMAFPLRILTTPLVARIHGKGNGPASRQLQSWSSLHPRVDAGGPSRGYPRGMRWLPAGGVRDAVLPAAIAVIGVIELLTLDDVTLPTGIGLEVTACALLIWRKNNPLVFCTLAGVAVLLM